MRKFFAVFLLFMTAVILFCGCAVTTTPLGNSGKTDGTITIGAILPLTGKFSERGKRMLEGVRYAIDELNNRRGISNRRIKLLIFDSQSSAVTAEQAYHSAAADGAEGIIAGYSTSEAVAMAPLSEKYRIPTIIPMATAELEDLRNPYLVRNAYTDKQQGESLAAYLWYWRQLIRISVLIDNTPSADYERNTARQTAEAFRELGGTVTNMPVYNGNDYSEALTDALVTGPQTIIISARGARAAQMVKVLRERGYSGTICGLDSWDDPEFFREIDKIQKLGDCIYVSFFTPENPSEEFRDFRAGFRQKNFHDPGSGETMAYDAVKMLAIGLSNASSIKDFQANWKTIHNYFGAAATYTTLSGGDIDRTIFINAVEPGTGPGNHAHGRLIRSFMYSKLESYRY